MTSATSHHYAPPPAGMNGPEPLMTSFLYAFYYRRAIIITAFISAFATGVGLLLMTQTYAASATFYVQSRPLQSASNISALVGSLGLPTGSQDVEGPQFFADLIVSAEVLEPLVREPLPAAVATSTGAKTLAELYGGDGGPVPLREDRALVKLRSKVIGNAVSAKTGVVRLSITTKVPELSAWLGTNLLARLNAFNLGRRQEQAGGERRFAEALLRQREDSLAAAEERLRSFVDHNRQHRNSPALEQAYERLQRDVAYQVSLRTSIASMYQEARIREVRDTPALIVLEPPRLPVRPTSRHIVRWTGVAFVGGFLLALAIAVFARAVSVQAARGDAEAAILLSLARQVGSRLGRFLPAPRTTAAR